MVDKLSGEKTPFYSHLDAQADPSGGPDILTIYLASVDNASHKRGTANQGTYLAWFDHRLALFVKELMARDPVRFNSTVFALVADHGHEELQNPPGPFHDDLTVREEICRLKFGDQKLEDLRDAAQHYQYLSYPTLVEEAIEDVAAVFAQGMNLYVYLRDPSGMIPETVARALLALPMTVPMAALVRVGDAYQLLQQDRGPDPIESDVVRNFLSARLGVPLADQDGEIANFQLDTEDGSDEQDIRGALRADAYFWLNIGARIRGFGPRVGVPARRSPDIVPLAPSAQTFTRGSGDHPSSSHGSLSYSTTRVPMMFFGPAIDGVHKIAVADMIDPRKRRDRTPWKRTTPPSRACAQRRTRCQRPPRHRSSRRPPAFRIAS